MSEPLLEANLSAEPVRLEPMAMRCSRRVLLVVLAAGLAVVLGLARWVTPDKRGFGTHEQLGLPPCAFRVITGIPCPSCGMTTSFAYVVRGQLLVAALTNPGGCLLALGAIVLIPWCLVSALAGRTIGLRSPERAAVVTVLIVVALSAVSWTIRIIFFREQG
jgi:hypothetical protein